MHMQDTLAQRSQGKKGEERDTQFQHCARGWRKGDGVKGKREKNNLDSRENPRAYLYLRERARTHMWREPGGWGRRDCCSEGGRRRWEKAIERLRSRRRDFVSRTLHSRNGKLPLIKIWAGRKRAAETAYTECIKGSRLTERHGVTATQSSSDNGRGSGEWIFYCRCAVPFVFLPTSLFFPPLSLFFSLTHTALVHVYVRILFLSFFLCRKYMSPTCFEFQRTFHMRNEAVWKAIYRELFTISIGTASFRPGLTFRSRFRRVVMR